MTKRKKTSKKENEDDTYEDTIHPGAVSVDGYWTTTRGHRMSVIGVVFDTPEGTEWLGETIHTVTPAVEHIEACPNCEEWVGKQTPLLHTAGHRILPCCMCDQFVWLARPDFEDTLKEALA
jgi:hypothetical protein